MAELFKFKMVDRVVVMYDHHPKKKCWSYAELRNTLLGTSDNMEGAVFGAPIMICDINEKSYAHPIFGTVIRSGWASMKVGKEMASTVSQFSGNI